MFKIGILHLHNLFLIRDKLISINCGTLDVKIDFCINFVQF